VSETRESSSPVALTRMTHREECRLQKRRVSRFELKSRYLPRRRAATLSTQVEDEPRVVDVDVCEPSVVRNPRAEDSFSRCLEQRQEGTRTLAWQGGDSL
jgi:hypothetical protein